LGPLSVREVKAAVADINDTITSMRELRQAAAQATD
jgi:hypothetical protein